VKKGFYVMGIRKLMGPGLFMAATASSGLFSQAASATEEIVVYGVDVASVQAAVFRSNYDEYLRALNEQLKGTLSKDLRQVVAAPKLIEAESEVTKG
jgi:hypothetical protein